MARKRFTLKDLEAKGFEVDGSGNASRKPGAKVQAAPVQKCRYDGNTIFIPGNIPSSKNSKQIWWKEITSTVGKVIAVVCRRKSDGKLVQPYITSSNATKAYVEASAGYYMEAKHQWHKLTATAPLPIFVRLTFVRSTNGKWDFHNAVQIVMDLMAEHKWISDDNVNFVLPVPPLPPLKTWWKDKAGAGVIIEPLFFNH